MCSTLLSFCSSVPYASLYFPMFRVTILCFMIFNVIHPLTVGMNFFSIVLNIRTICKYFFLNFLNICRFTSLG